MLSFSQFCVLKKKYKFARTNFRARRRKLVRARNKVFDQDTVIITLVSDQEHTETIERSVCTTSMEREPHWLMHFFHQTADFTLMRMNSLPIDPHLVRYILLFYFTFLLKYSIYLYDHSNFDKYIFNRPPSNDRLLNCQKGRLFE